MNWKFSIVLLFFLFLSCITANKTYTSKDLRLLVFDYTNSNNIKIQNEILEITKVLEETIVEFNKNFNIDFKIIMKCYYSTIYDARATFSLKNNYLLIDVKDFMNYDKETLQIIFAHELFHLYQGRIIKFPTNPWKSKTAKKFYFEGCATFASALIFPNHDDRKYINYSNNNIDKYNLFFDYQVKAKALLIEDILANKSDYSDILFSGNYEKTKPLPPRIGYFLGYFFIKEQYNKKMDCKCLFLNEKEFLSLFNEEYSRM